MTTVPSTSHLEPRGKFVLRGLIATGRAPRPAGQQPENGLLKLTRTAGGHFWLSLDGETLLAGDTFAEAEELQPSFVELMARIGTP
jgi:hypothetical protein